VGEEGGGRGGGGVGRGGRARSQVLGHVKCVYCRVKGICTQRDSDRKRERV